MPKLELMRLQESEGEVIDSESGMNRETLAHQHLKQKKKESLMNLILSFLVYRPDVGYVKVSLPPPPAYSPLLLA